MERDLQNSDSHLPLIEQAEIKELVDRLVAGEVTPSNLLEAIDAMPSRRVQQPGPGQKAATYALRLINSL